MERTVALRAAAQPQLDAEARVAELVREALPPLDQHDRVRPDAREQPQLLEWLAGIESVQIRVDHRQSALKLVQDLESRASHGFCPRDSERVDDGLHQARFAGAQAALQDHQVPWAERLGEAASEARRVAPVA